MIDYTERRLRSKFGWLSPRGYFIHCEYATHHIMAQKLRGKTAFLPSVDRFSNEDSVHKREEELLELGWIKISWGKPRIHDAAEAYVTEKQYNFLRVYLEFHKIIFPLDLRIK